MGLPKKVVPFDNERKTNMKALITGASSGIGRDVARELSKKGYDLILVARDENKLQQLKQELTTNIEIVSLDLSNVENCKELYEKHKDIDILINNAGFGDCGKFWETDLDKEIQMIQTNIIAYHVLTKLYLKNMKEKGSGIILNVASIAGFMPGPLMATYYSTKAYVVRLTQAIRHELFMKHSKVKITALCPGPVKTNFNKVAQVNFGPLGQSSGWIAKVGINAMFHGRILVFGSFFVWLARFFAKILPDQLMAFFTYLVQRPKIEKK